MKSKIFGFDGSRAFVKDRTGTENYSYQLLKALAKVDHKNQYIVYLRPNVTLNIVKGIKLYPSASPQDDNLRWPKNFEFKTINYPRLWTQVGLARQTFKDKLDVLFVPAHTIPIIKKPGLKTVITVHDLGSEYLPGMHQLKQRLYLGFMQRQQLKNAFKIIAVSNATKDDLVHKIGINSDKVAVVYEGYNSEEFRVQSSELKKKPDSYYLFVGTVQPRKNLERIIEAVKILNKKLLIAGSKGWLSDSIYAKASQNIKFLGRVDDKDLPGLYKGAIALVYPSLFEGFGLPILEAQACGCPVITSNISSMPEVAGKGAILVDPYNVNDIVKAMEQINNQDTRNKLIKAGLENVKRFSWEKCAKETLKVLENI